MITISVIIPTYNVAEYIEEGLLSVLHQTYPATEIICVDDGSSDTTVEIIKKIQAAFPNRISLYQNETNRGATYTRNKGLAIATGDYLQFFDADDLLYKDKFEKQVQLIQEKKPQPDIIVSDFYRRSVDGREELYHFPEQDAWCAALETSLGVTSGNLYKRSAVLAVKGWTEDLKSSQEYDLMFRMLANGATVTFDHNPIACIRERVSGSISKTNPRDRWKRYIDLRIKMFNHLKANKMVNDLRHQFFINIMFDAIRILYKYDKKTALKLHREYITSNGHPRPSLITSRRYLSIYNVFGFKIAEYASKLMNPKTEVSH